MRKYVSRVYGHQAPYGQVVGTPSSLDLGRQHYRQTTTRAPLGISIEEAAYSIYAVSNETMINAIKDITVSEGIDPAETIIVAGGGAAGHGRAPAHVSLRRRAVARAVERAPWHADSTAFRVPVRQLELKLHTAT